ncbi:MAG: hypothetical protein HRU19_20890 [Pseudobacteriovorax sp.]|nr:hypothetical protein [Pseudobacteriovorax sp.]
MKDAWINFLLSSLVGILSLHAFGDEIEVTVNLLPAGAWQKDDKALIQGAATEAFRRLATSDVANCGYRHTTKENKNQIRKRWGNSMPVINKSRKVTLTVEKKSLRKGVLGQAKVGVAQIDKRHYRIENLRIDLGQEALHDHLKTASAADRENIWIMVIAHEVAHNMGFSHGTKGTWQEKYPGYFATEIGYCAMNNGSHGYKKRY